MIVQWTKKKIKRKEKKSVMIMHGALIKEVKHMVGTD